MKSLLEYAREHRDSWKDEGDHYWLARLQQEVAELTLVLDEQHEGPMIHELAQIAAICMNWLYWNDAFEYPEDEDETFVHVRTDSEGNTVFVPAPREDD